MIQKSKLDLIFDINPEIPKEYFGDDKCIRQILINLLNNAVKYTRKGEVWLKIDKEDADDERIILKFTIQDTGIGIKQEDIDRIMIPYERFDINKNRNIEGSGLGLPITFRLLAEMGSKMKVDSEYGKGSEFSFVLRQGIVEAVIIAEVKKDKTEENEQNYTYEPMFEAPNARVLVVDDNKMNRKVFKAL